MVMWKAEKIDLVHLDCYNIIEYNGNSYFVGNHMDHYGARRSTAIQAYDEETKQGVTASGTRYQLHGEPGLDSNGLYLLGRAMAHADYSLRW